MAFYTEAWLLYSAGLLGLLYLMWRVSRRAGFSVRLWLLALTAAVFGTPWYALPETPSSLAPALMVAVIEFITEGSAERGLLPILCVFMVLLVAGYAGRYVYQRMRGHNQAVDEPPQTAESEQS